MNAFLSGLGVWGVRGKVVFWVVGSWASNGSSLRLGLRRLRSRRGQLCMNSRILEIWCLFWPPYAGY